LTDRQDIRRALEQTLNNGSYTGVTNADDIAFENLLFDPTGKDIWIRPRLSIVEQLPSVIGSGNAVRWSGLFLVDCFVKENTATASADVLADEVLAVFPYGTQITENSKIINVRFAESFGAIHDPPWYFVPISITFYSFIS